MGKDKLDELIKEMEYELSRYGDGIGTSTGYEALDYLKELQSIRRTAIDGKKESEGI